MAQTINKIAEQKPKVIGLDIIFKDRKLEFTDSILKSVLDVNKNIVTSYYHDNDSVVYNNDYFKLKNENKGYINLNLKGQNTVIRDFIGVKGKDNKEFAFATQLALAAGYIDKANALKELKKPIPINYIGNKDVFLNFDIDEISTYAIPALKDAVVILGYLGDGEENYDIEKKDYK